MAKQTINIGTAVNDGTGSTLRVGGDMINDNFTELYAVNAAAPLVYVGLLTQSGTDAPISIIIKNTLGITTYTYENVGVFNIANPLFIIGKTFVSITNSRADKVIYISQPSDGFITITVTTASTNININDGMNNSTIKIEVYP